jgi:WD40 repeat protein
MANFQRNLAVVIGINDYQNQVPKLKTAKNDAEVLAKLLTDSHQYEVTLITEETECKPRLDSLLNLLEKQLPEKINKDDRLLFYFAGHGIAKESDRGPAGFLVPQDADLKNQATLLPMQTLHDRLAALKCRHLLVILDCCFAGTLRWSSSRLATVIPRQINQEHYDRFIKYPAWQAITSAAHNQEAYDINPNNINLNINNRQTVAGTNHSPFAEALFKALQGEADIMPPAQKNKPAGDGVITATELSQYLQYEVAEIAGDSQTPQLWSLQKEALGEYIFLHPNRPPQLKPAPELNKDNNPYRGLESFEEKHAQFFFGRQELIKKLAARISESQQPLTVVLGVSGSGKSSLVKAGLIPCLKHLSKSEFFEENIVSAYIVTAAVISYFPHFPLKFLPLGYIYQWETLTPMRPGEFPLTAFARTIFPISDFSIDNELKTVEFLREVLQQKIDNLDRKIDGFDETWKQDEECKQLEQEREKFQGFRDDWSNNPKKLFSDCFEELYALCEQDDFKQELSKVCLDCLNRFSQSLNFQKFVNIIREWSRNNPDRKLLLVIDQFEELITLSRDEEKDKKSNKQPEGQQFLKLLEEVVAANLEELRIVVTLRSDFEPRFLNSDALKSHWAKARFPVRPMRSDELRQAIERPAAEMALYFEPPNLVDRLIEEVGQMPGALPLLSFTLSEFYIKLYESWKPGNTDRALRIDVDFDKEGGVAGSLTRRANQEYNKLPDDAHRATMRRVMLRMVTLEGGEPVRRRVSLSELVYASKQEPNQPDREENQRVKVVLECFDKARLVVSGQETEEPYVEPAHDFLVKGWDKLQKWLEEYQQDLLLQRRLTLVAEEWKKKEDSTSLAGKAEPFLRRLDKKIDFAGEWLKQIKDGEVQEIIEKAQIKLQQAIGELTGNPKVATFLIKTEKFLKLLDGKIDFSEKWLQKIRPQKTPESSPKKKVQFLWNGNPYLDVLKKTLKSSDYWFNQVEAEFLQQSIWQRRRNINFRWAIALTVTFIILFGVYVRFLLIDLTERATRAKNLLSSPYPLNGLLLAIQATGKSQSLLKPFLEPAWPRVQSSLRDAIETVREVNILYPGGKVRSIDFSADGQHIITTTENEVNVWNIDGSPSDVDPNTIALDTNTIAAPSKKTYSADGQKTIRISSGDEGAREEIVEIKNSRGDIIQHIPFYDTNSIAVRFDGKYAVTAGGNQGKVVKLWDLQGNAVNVFSGEREAVNSVAISPEQKTKDAVNSVAISPDGQTIVSGSEDKTLRLWNLQGKSLILPHEDAVNSVAISPDGQTIVSGSEDKTVRLWGAKGKFIGELPHPDAVQEVAISPDSQTLVSVSNETVYLWGIKGNLINKFSPDGGVSSIAFYDDRTVVIAGNGGAGAVQLWDLNRQKTRVIFEEPRGGRIGRIGSLAVSFDRQTIVAGGDNSVYLWNQQGKLVSQPFPNSQGTFTVTISKDSQYIVSGDGGGMVKLWDRQGNSIGEPLKISKGYVKSVAISPNGEYLVSGNSDNTVRLWRAGNWQSWLRIGCDRLGHHQSLNDSFDLKHSQVNREARATCQKYVWK